MNRSAATSLAAIVALARSGALDRAKDLFREAGFEAVTDNPAVLSVHGRLLKDQARRTSGASRKRLYKASGEAYAGAAALSGASYHLINAATLALLAGDRDAAEARAIAVLERLDAGKSGPETPYYLAATRAEALLLLGQTQAARDELAAAFRIAPRAWEDHATTLRQFRLILETENNDTSWLNSFRPPQSLHFAGHLAVMDENELRTRVESVLEADRIGFAYGALAGGADLIVAEAALSAGAELHLTLPAPAPVFRAESAEPLGGRWASRFDAVLERADSVSVIEPGLTNTTILHVRLAAEMAMGKAVMKATALSSEAVQLLLVDPAASTSVTALLGEHWRSSGRRQICIVIARTARSARRGRRLSERPDDGVLAAMLAIGLDDARGGGDPFQSLERVADVLARAARPVIDPVLAGNALHLAFGNPAEGAQAASLLNSAFGPEGLRIAGHYGVARLGKDPFGNSSALVGPATSIASDLLASTPSGATHLTETFAASLHAWARISSTECAYIGDLKKTDGIIPLYALTAADP